MSIDASGAVVASTFIATSDERYKQDITPLSKSLAHVLALRSVSYEFKKSVAGHRFSSKRQVGFIAQETERVVPEVVHTDANGFKGINYGALVAVAIDATREVWATVTANGDRLAALEREPADEGRAVSSVAARSLLPKVAISTARLGQARCFAHGAGALTGSSGPRTRPGGTTGACCRE